MAPPLAEVFHAFLKIGLLSFGGPAGQIAMMHRILVEEKAWISESRFLHGLNFCTLLPGPEAMQLATYVGWLLHGVRGGVIAGTLFVAPGFLVIVGLSAAYALFQHADWFASLFFGLKAAVLAIVLEAVLRVARKSLRTRAAYLVATASFFALFVLRVPFPLVVFGAGMIGYLRRDLFVTGAMEYQPVLTRRASDAGWSHVVRTLVIWCALWVALPLALVIALGGSSIVLPLSLFFSKMAVVTFGGAYAVLAYVAQAAVETFGWLKPGQMIDGLALAETTPGPLILVLTFVGFQAAFQAPGGLAPLLSGIIGAVVTTWVTFIPCFLWIFLGAPYLEVVRRNARLSGALAGIGAAVVGVILNLSLWFAMQTLFRQVGESVAGPVRMSWPVWNTVDVPALSIAVVAMVAMFGLNQGMVRVLALCAVLGFAVRIAF